MAEKNGTAYLVLANRDVKEWREDFHGAQMYWSHFGKQKYQELIAEVGFKLIWDEVENLPNGEDFYNVILKKE